MSSLKPKKKSLLFIPLILGVFAPTVYGVGDLGSSNVLSVVDGTSSVEYKPVGSDLSIRKVLSAHGENIDDYRKQDGSTISNKETIKTVKTVYKLKKQVDSSEIVVPFTVERTPNDSLFEGEERVVREGIDGHAIRTNIKASNGDDNALDIPDSNKSVLTVTKTPVSKIVEYGTKKRVRNNGRRWFTGYGNWKLNPNVLANIDDTAHPVIPLLKAQVGKPYVWGAIGGNSFDCSGLVYWAFKGQLGYNIPRTAYPQGLSGKQISYNNIKPGDVVYNAYHIGVYVGDNKVIHAANPNDGVIVTPLQWFMNDGYMVARF